MARLKHPNTVPPGGWVYVQMETKARFEDENLHQLVAKVAAHRAYKQLERADRESVRDDVERQVCSGLAGGECQAEPGEDYRPTEDQTHVVTLAALMKFSASLVEWAVSALGLVDEAETQRRTEICRGCRFNKPASSCSCGPLYRLVDSVIPKSRRMGGLHVCAACGCVLSLKVLAPRSVIEKSNEGRGIIFPAHCWQLRLP